jgi:uncharacterized protein
MEQVRHNTELDRFELSLHGETAVLEYRETPQTIAFLHTIVPEKIERQGIGSLLAKAGLDYAREKQLRVQPDCTFVAAYIERHPEYQDLL